MRNEQEPISIAYASLMARCPRCGEGKLYVGLLDVADKCSVCSLPLKKHEQGDGPAFFCICIIGSFTGILATITEVMFQPPFWLHAVIWLPLVIVSSLFGIRATKAALITMQYRFRPEDFS